ncbi:DNA (cytosine-5-)-methyltransferase, partial [Neisseria mucosa ATCC 25996]
DNLEVLKHLKNAYANSVKMIYIDPPYNTGSDGFVYQDDRKFTPEELARLANIDEDEAARILDFTDKGSNSHSAWLTFMYPRLYIARELLKDDGVIFISIDDNEAAQLKLLCDEVFGEGNFVEQIIWEKKFSPQNDAKYFSENHDYLICYAKNITELEIKLLPRTEGTNARYKNIDNDPRGAWTSG